MSESMKTVVIGNIIKVKSALVQFKSVIYITANKSDKKKISIASLIASRQFWNLVIIKIKRINTQFVLNHFVPSRN